MITLDHLAIAGETLDTASAHVEEALGVSLQPGGQHAHFGTHNCLLGLEDDLYLEVIAIDPSAPAPAYPRWFDLDRFSGAPRLSNWICRTNDLPKMTNALPQAGQAVKLARGDLRWQMAVPRTGILPMSGAFPALMAWESDNHPAKRLTASGCRLSRLMVTHPEAAELTTWLAPYLDDTRIIIENGAAGLKAEFDTPHGPRVLS